MNLAVFIQGFFVLALIFYGFYSTQHSSSGRGEAIISQAAPIEFTMKPTGEVKFKGTPDADIIQQLVASSDYQVSSDRTSKQEIELCNAQAADRITLLTICFLGASFIITIVCFFWSYNANKEGSNSNVNREFIRGDSCK
ncbi:hypothetical protein [Nostoc sp. DedSLP03]|uniref:hypothetical protein n=1 Tax=Nostoc sp. DedSLP03 TaxID=3075400 RepID=UPI002AD58A17|nr:hypothetical protein [Nostoc sp. DedSLP03]